MANASEPPPLTIPEGFTLHTENTARILLPATNEAFLNPVQEFNRDMSVACIRTWSEEVNATKERKWRERFERSSASEGKGKGKGRVKKLKTDSEANSVAYVEAKSPTDVVMTGADAVAMAAEAANGKSNAEDGAADATKQRKFGPYRVVILEALSATGLRAIRYAKEIPLVKYVIANDLSPAAVEAIKRNVAINGIGENSQSSEAVFETKSVASKSEDASTSTSKSKSPTRVKINEGDACTLMYSHRVERLRVDCVDLDPYGTAAPFIDAAVQCVNDGGLLCVTCTDMTVLATNNYPEKCFSNYGGVPVKAEYCHEAALRLVLHTISTSASRYGRYIQPLLSLSIDFYVRLFVRIQSAPIEVKKAASKTSMYHVCSGCQAFYEQPLGKIVEKASAKSGQVNYLYRQQAGPPVGDKCPECDSTLHIAGPMWSGPIHDGDFAAKVLTHLDSNMDKYGTSTRMKGMLTVAKEELTTPFYFTPSRVAGFFHCISPSLEDVSNALLHAGFAVSRSHAYPGSIKTTATRQDVYDIMRGWIKTHPVKAESISPTSPSYHLHSRQPRFEANFAYHPQSVTQSSKIKLVRYQQNPAPNWGPGTKASGKRKRDGDEEGNG